MKILYLCNYASWLKVSKGIMPSHHLFGVNEIIDTWNVEGTSAVIKKQYGGGSIDFLLVKDNSAVDAFKVCSLAWKYDVVYDTLCSVTKYLGIINRLHLFPAKLVSIYHFPSPIKMKTGKADTSVFFTKALMEEAESLIGKNRNLLCNSWYPDNKWYEIHRTTNIEKDIDFMDNGKTGRDHETFIQALIKTAKSGVIICSEAQKLKFKRDGANLKFFCQNITNDLNVLEYSNRCKVMCIPLDSDAEILSPIGYTSYMDAIALEMPVITTKNAAMSQEIIDNKLGMLYTPFDADSLAEAMRIILDNYDMYQANMVAFRKTHDIKQYSERIVPYLTEK